MKRYKLVSTAMVVSGLLLGCNNQQSEKSALEAPLQVPSPLEIRKSEGVKAKLAKKAWFEDMHQAAEDIDWRKKDIRHRERKNLRFIKNKAKTKLTNFLKKRGAVADSPFAAPVPEAQTASVDAPLAADAVAAGVVDGVWKEKGSNNQAGRIRSVDYYPATDALYAGADGGQIWKASFEGNDWVSLNDQMKFQTIKSLYVIEVNGNPRIFVLDNKYAYYSDDEGQTWNVATGLTSVLEWGYMSHAEITSNNTIYVLTQEWNNRADAGIYVSTDNGASFTKIWNKVTDKTRYIDIAVDRHASNATLYMVDSNSVYSWNGSSFNLQSQLDYSVDSDIQNNLANTYLLTSGNRVYVGAHSETNGNQTHIFKSTNSAQNFTYQSFITERPWAKKSIALVREEADEIVLGAANTFKSTDGGQTWEEIYTWQDYSFVDHVTNLHADIPEIRSFEKNGEEFFIICTDAGVYYSDDHLLNVLNISLTNLNVSQYYSTYTHPTKPHIIYAGSQDQSIQATTSTEDGPVAFDALWTGDIGHVVSADGGVSHWHVAPGSVWMYENFEDPLNNVKHWLELHTIGISGQTWMHPIIEHPSIQQSVLLAGGGRNNDVHLYRLWDNGNSSILSWEELPFDFKDGDNNTYISAIGYSKVNTNIWYVMKNNGKFWFSTNGGQNWTKSSENGPSPHYFYGADIVADPIDQNKLYVSGSGYSTPGVYVSTNNGLNFTPITNGLPETMIYQLAISDDGQYLFAATEVGAYVMPTSGTEWFDLEGVPQVYWSVEWVESIKTARFGTYGRGIWDFTLDQDPVSSSSEPVSSSSVVSSSSEPVSSSSSVVTLPNFGNKAAPGRLEAEHFDAFNELTAGNNGNWADRNGENTGVDMEFTGDVGGGANVGWTDGGEWLEYNFNVAQSGSYAFSLRVASAQGTRNVSVSVNGAAAQSFSYTGSQWQTYQDLVTVTANLAAGQNTVRVTFIDGATNLNYIDVTTVALSSSSEPVSSSSVVSSSSEPVSSSSVVSSSSEPVSSSSVVSSSSEPVSSSSVVSSSSEPVSSSSSVVTLPNFGNKAAPGKLEAEFFDTFNELTAGNNGNWADRNGENTGVDMEFTGDVGGGANVGWTDGGEWLEYNFNVAQSGSYAFSLRVASAQGTRNVSVSVNGAAAQNFSYTGSQWQSYADLTTVTANLTAGQNTVRVTFLDGATNLNYIDVQTVAVSSSSEEPSSSSEEPSSSSEEPSSSSEPVSSSSVVSSSSEPVSSSSVVSSSSEPVSSSSVVSSSSEPVSSSSVVSSSSEPVSSSSVSTGVTGTEYDACVQTNGSVDVGVPGKNNGGDFFGGYRNGQWFFGQQQSSCANGVCNISNVSANVGDSFQYFCQGGGCDSDGYYPGNNNQPGSVLTLRSCN